MKRVIGVLGLGCVLLFACIAIADEPILVINPHGHSDVITDLLFTPDGQTLISVSQDKTILLWDTKTGDLIKAIRGQIGEGNQGQIRAAALTPDGKMLAVAGDMSYHNDEGYGSIRVFDLATGEQIGSLAGHTDAVNDLAFAPNGQWLASGSWDQTVKLWDLTNITHASKNAMQAITLQGHAASVGGVAFAPDGKKLVSASDDGTLRVWQLPQTFQNVKDPANLKYTVMQKHTAKVSCVAYAPNGKYIVSGGYDRKILLWDGNGRFIKEIAEYPGELDPEYSGDVETVAFSADSQNIVFGGKESFQVLVYSIPQGENITTFTQYPDTVFASAFYGNDLIATAGGDQVIYLWDARSGAIITEIPGQGEPVWALAFGKDLNLAFGNTNRFSPRIDEPSHDHPDFFPLERTFNFMEMTLQQQPPNEREFIRARTEYQGKLLKYLNKHEVQVTRDLTIQNDPDFDGWLRTYTFTPTGDIVVGNSYSLLLYRAEGTYLRSFVGHTGEIWAVSASADGRFFASASNDQTIKLWSLTDPGEFPPLSVLDVFTDPSWVTYFKDAGLQTRAQEKSRKAWEAIIAKMKADGDQDYQLLEEQLTNLGGIVAPLATLFVAADNEWVCWLPQGYYAASAGGEQYIGWQINQGVDNAATYYPVSVFRKKFYHPELVKRTIALGNFEQALAEINSNARQVIEKRSVTQLLPPQVEWIAPQAQSSETTQPSLRIQATIHSDSPITEIKLLVNGRTQATGRGLSVASQQTISGNEINQDVSLTEGSNTITIFAANENAGATSDERVVLYRVHAEEDLLKPNLYMVSVGISGYQKSELQLEYADDDARAMSELYRSQEGKLYKKVTITELYDQEATREGILEALEWLEKETTQKDIAVIFMAAHGINDDRGKFYLLPADGDPEKLRSTGVDWGDFIDVLGNLPSKVLLFLDTCHSGQLGKNLYQLRGQIDNTEAIRELSSEENGVVILAASTGQEFSMEHPEWGHGAFTKALLDGLKDGKADLTPDGIISLQELDYYVSERVKELTDGKQHPTTLKPSTISRFPIIQVK